MICRALLLEPTQLGLLEVDITGPIEPWRKNGTCRINRDELSWSEMMDPITHHGRRCRRRSSRIARNKFAGSVTSMLIAAAILEVVVVIIVFICTAIEASSVKLRIRFVISHRKARKRCQRTKRLRLSAVAKHRNLGHTSNVKSLLLNRVGIAHMRRAVVAL